MRRIIGCIARNAIAIGRASAFDTAECARLHAAAGTFRTEIITTATMCGIVRRIDFHITAIHGAIPLLARSCLANQSFIASGVTASTVINICCCINGISRTIGHSCTRDTGVILTNQTVGTCIVTTTASIDRAYGNFVFTTISCSIAELALSAVTN